MGSFDGDGDVLLVNGATSGTIDGIDFLWNPTLKSLVFNGAASADAYEDLLSQVQFLSTSNNPTNYGANPTRDLVWSVSDGETPSVALTTVVIDARNDAPDPIVAPTAAYTENAAPTTISPATILTDIDSLNLTAGQIAITTGGLAGDMLSVNGLAQWSLRRYPILLRSGLAQPVLRRFGTGRGLPGLPAGRAVPLDEREPDESWRQPNAHALLGRGRRQGRQRARHHHAEHLGNKRCAGQRRARHRVRQRRRKPADRRHFGCRRRQHAVHHDAHGSQGDPDCLGGRRGRYRRQRHRGRDHQRDVLHRSTPRWRDSPISAIPTSTATTR